MNVKRFTARTSREALAKVRHALGEDAVVLSTRPSPQGVEVLALAPEGMARIEQAAQASQAAQALQAAQAAQAAPHAQAAPIHLAVQAALRAPPLPHPAPTLAAAPPTAPARPPSLAERIAARGERLLSRNAPRREPSLGPDDDTLPRQSSQHDNAHDRLPDSEHRAAADTSVAHDVQTLGMSTLTFQDYVRERMLRRRQAELAPTAPSVSQALMAATVPPPAARAAPGAAAAAMPAGHPTRHPTSPSAHPSARPPARQALPEPRLDAIDDEPSHPGGPAPAAALSSQPSTSRSATQRREPPVLRDRVQFAGGRSADLAEPASRGDRGDDGFGHDSPLHGGHPPGMGDLQGELRSVRALIEERFGMLAFMERLQRDPRQVGLSQKLFDTGLSPALVRKLVQALPADAPDPLAWAAGVLERNVLTNEQDAPLEDHEGVFALIGPTGVGKTTSTAKLAAAFATRHGAGNLGLVTLDAYRVAAHEQLRTYGRILGVPVHTAHDRASLEDLLDLLSAKKLVLIDTAGMAQRDARTRELLDMLAHRAIHKLLVVNAAAQGETVEDVLVSYGVQNCHGVIVSKLDEAVKLGPALDALIRHRGRVVGVANGQRVPEDWHRLSAQALVQRALRGGGGTPWRLDTNEINLMFAATQGAGYPGPQASQAALHA